MLTNLVGLGMVPRKTAREWISAVSKQHADASAADFMRASAPLPTDTADLLKQETRQITDVMG